MGKRKRKDITAVQAELLDVLVLKYENKNAVTVKGQCGHVWTTEAGGLRRGNRCVTCSNKGGKGPRTTIDHLIARLPRLEVLVLSSAAATVKYKCGHTQVVSLDKLQNVDHCSRRECRQNVDHCSRRGARRKDITAVQAEFPDVLVLKYEGKKAATVKGQCGHVWTTEVGSLRKGQRCGSCALRGYSQDKPGWLYLMERPGEMQVGITNHIDQRLTTHARNGWSLLDVDGPHDGATIFSREQAIRTYLRSAELLIDGTLENWPTASWEPPSLAVIEDIAA